MDGINSWYGLWVIDLYDYTGYSVRIAGFIQNKEQHVDYAMHRRRGEEAWLARDISSSSSSSFSTGAGTGTGTRE